MRAAPGPGLARRSLPSDSGMLDHGNIDVVILVACLAEFLTVGLASGAIAGFLLHTDLSTNWVAGAGLVGTALEPWLPLDYGPVVFGYCVLACIATSALAIVAARFIRVLHRGGRGPCVPARAVANRRT